MSEFLAALAAVPAIITALESLVGWLENTFGPNWPQRIADLQSASVLWNKAQTDEERTNAAHALALAFNSHK